MASIEALERENAELRVQVAALTRRSKDGSARPVETAETSHPEVLPPPSTIPSSTAPEQQMPEFVKLAKRFKALSENFRKAREALERRKGERDAWKVRFQSLQASARAAEQKHDVSILDPSLEEPEPFPATGILPGSSFNLPDDPTATTREHDEPELPPAKPTSTSSGTPSGKVLGPLDSTQGESEGLDDNELPSLPTTDAPSDVAIKNEPSSDVPFVVSERAVKKRKLDSDQESRPVRVKLEPQDDSSPIASETRRLESQESIDLGNISHKMMTPRKRRELELVQHGNASANGSAMATPVPTYVRPDAVPQTTRPAYATSALTPLSVNLRRIRSGGDKSLPRAVRRQLDDGIASLAEDGDHYTNYGHQTPIRSSKAGNPPSKNRLDALLNSPITSEQTALPQSAKSHRSGKVPATDGLPIPVRRELPFDKTGRQIAKPQSPATTLAPAAATPRRPASPPKRRQLSALRRKPVSELRLEDFKINPLANEGHDFAFSDVVRDKADRSCLPGCTDMHCCGKEFRALALSQRPDPPLTAAQRQDEQRLLEEYLGDYSYRLATMNKEERSELWTEAKTQELANKYGKHRHRYSRMRSPPGFWDADFPSTQELEANRQEAAERQKKSIQERHREAMRPGGRWIFRDE